MCACAAFVSGIKETSSDGVRARTLAKRVSRIVATGDDDGGDDGGGGDDRRRRLFNTLACALAHVPHRGRARALESLERWFAQAIWPVLASARMFARVCVSVYTYTRNASAGFDGCMCVCVVGNGWPCCIARVCVCALARAPTTTTVMYDIILNRPETGSLYKSNAKRCARRCLYARRLPA